MCRSIEPNAFTMKSTGAVRRYRGIGDAHADIAWAHCAWKVTGRDRDGNIVPMRCYRTLAEAVKVARGVVRGLH